MVWPVFFGPVSLVYLVVMVSFSAAGASAFSFSGVAFGASAALACGSSFFTTSFSFGASTACGSSLTGAFGASAFGSGFGVVLGSRSILPTALGLSTTARALITSCRAFSRSSFSCSKRSCSKRRDSFSFRFSSLISAEASRLDLSV